jgi:hypothetical protein
MKMKKGRHDEIARVAYERYEKGGRADANDINDWLEAEKIVMEKHERHARNPKRGIGVLLKKKGFRCH